jgi:hypothetical protein
MVKFGKKPRRLAGLVPRLGGGMHLGPDDLPQPLIARQAEDQVHAMVFAPAHQLVAAESGIPRTMMFTSGQAARICATILCISARQPKQASWLDSR